MTRNQKFFGARRWVQPTAAYTPRTLNPDLWVRADLSVLTSSGAPAVDSDPVFSWQGQGAVPKAFTQNTASRRPTLKTNIVNGHPVLRFDGVDDSLYSSVLVSSAGNYTFAAVAKVTAGAGTVRTLFFNGAAASNNGWRVSAFSTNVAEVAHRGVANMTNGALPAGFAIWVATRTATGPLATLRINKADVALANSTAALTTPTTESVIGGQGPGSAVPWNGDIAEIVVVGRVISGAEITALESYFSARYGL